MDDAAPGESRRGAGNVLGNGGFALIISVFGILGFLDLDSSKVLIGASFSAALSDTVSSELGTLSGGLLAWMLI